MTKKGKVLEGIRNLDLFANSPVEQLHFNGQEKHKTVTGGTWTIIMVIVLLVIITVRAIPILKKENKDFSGEKEILS